MALTNVTVVRKIQLAEGNQYEAAGTLDLDNSYPTGGYALSLSGTMERIRSCEWRAPGYLGQWDAANQKMKLFRQTAATSALVEVANAVDLSALTGVPFTARGL